MYKKEKLEQRYYKIRLFLGTSMEGGMPGPSHGNNELNQEQQGESMIYILFGSASTITNSNNLAITSELYNESRSKEGERNLDRLKW